MFDRPANEASGHLTAYGKPYVARLCKRILALPSAPPAVCGAMRGYWFGTAEFWEAHYRT
jgi:hypothetical protein